MQKCVFLGVAGSGKSTLINTLTGRNSAIVGHELLNDGTVKISDFPFSPSISFIDTPGLDSKNVFSGISDIIQKDYTGQNFLIVLVISAFTARLTNYIKDFDKARRNLVGSAALFCIVWTNCENADRSFGPPSVLTSKRAKDIKAMQTRYPRSRTFYDSSIDEFREFLSSPGDSFQRLVVSADRRGLGSANASGIGSANASGLGSTNASGLGSATVSSEPARDSLIFTKSMRSITSLVQLARNVPPDVIKNWLEKLCDIKHDEKKKCQDLCLMGDASLRFIVYSILHALKNETIETTGKNVVGNNPDQPMAKFYDEYIATVPLTRSFFEASEEISSHTKANVVEALVELTRPQSGSVYAFVLVHLFRYANIDLPQV